MRTGGPPDKRLSVRPDGTILVQNKTRWRDGTTHVVMTPDQFMQRLVALVPGPQANLTRYHGVFAARHRLRSKIVPGQPEQLDLRRTQMQRIRKPRSRPSPPDLTATIGRPCCGGCSKWT
jgi:hypothetical protein